MALTKPNENCHRCQCLPLCMPKEIPAEILATLSHWVNQQRTSSKHEILIHLGEPFTHLYVLRSGSLKAWQVDEAGHERVLDFYFPGELIGLEAMHQQQYLFNIQALEPASICEINYDKLNELVLLQPTLQTHLLQLTSQKLSTYCKLLHHDVSKRLITFLQNIQSRMGLQHETEITLPMSRADIGNYLNLTAETISRLFTRLELDGQLSVHGKRIQIKPHLA